MPGKQERYWNIRVSFELGAKDPISCEMTCAIVADSMIDAYDGIQSYLEVFHESNRIGDVEVWSIEEFSNT